MFKKLNDNNILHIALHTCFDRDVYGTSYQIAKHIPNLTNLQSLPENPYVLKAELMQPMKVSNFLQVLKDTHLFNSLRYIEQQKDWTIKSVAIGAGSCSSYLNEVYFNQVDCFITGDIKWHGYQDAYNAHVVAIDINHDAEQVFIPTIVERLNQLEDLNTTPIKSLFNTLVIKEFN